jgi:hypothetical protein
MVGAQIGGFYQLSYGPARGMQLAWGVNMALGGLRGLQAAPFANVSNGEVHGLQAAMVNINRGSLHGLQAGLVNLTAERMRGLQAGLVNIVKSDVHGLQAGLINLNGLAAESNGAPVGQASGNGSVGMCNGAMVGLVNVGRKVHGAQVGLVNIASEVEGAQVGLVNFAKKNEGASIALLPIVLDGYNHGLLWYSAESALNLGAKLGTKHVYVVLGVGMTRDNYTNGHREFSSTFGIGGHITPLPGPFFLDADATWTQFATLAHWQQERRQLTSLRLQAGWQFARHFAVIAGPTLNVQVAENPDDRAPRAIEFAEQVWHRGDHTVRVYPGLVAGLQF